MFLTLFAIVVFFVPTFGGLFLETPNFEPANPMSTPEHIAPVWYFTPYYAILRAVPDQRLGALLMALSVLVFLFLPWLDRARTSRSAIAAWSRSSLLGMFFVTFLVLMWLGPAAGRRHLRAAGAHLHRAVLRVLHPAAVRVQGRRQGPVPDRVTYHAH